MPKTLITAAIHITAITPGQQVRVTDIDGDVHEGQLFFEGTEGVSIVGETSTKDLRFYEVISTKLIDLVYSPAEIALIAEVRAYALEHYNEGWDVLIECWENADIAREIGRARTLKGAIKKIKPGIELREEHRKDIVGLGDPYDYAADVFADEVVAAPEPEVSVTLVVPQAEAKTLAVLEQDFYGMPEATDAGAVCGRCSKEERDRTGDRKAQVRHASTSHVRFCYGQAAMMEAEVFGELETERAVERHFEEGRQY